MKGRFEIGLQLLNMVLSRLLFFRRGLTTAVFREFRKLPERSEAFTTSRRSASKQFNTLLKKDVGSASRAVHSQKKRYKSCHWGCTFSKGTLLYLKGAYWYRNGTY